MRRRRLVRTAEAAVCAACLVVIPGCTGLRTVNGSQERIKVIAAANPQMVNLQRFTNRYFTAETGITVDYTLLPENEARQRISRDFSDQAARYDVASVSAYEVPFYSENGWLVPLDSYAKADSTFDQGDFFPNLITSLTGADGKIYAEPFYGEGSFLMYRRDIFNKAGLTMPQHPTWAQVASLASKAGGTDGAKGICLRGLPGWGQNLAPLNTVVNTMGGSWYDMKWNARLTSPEFKEAVRFYVDLVRRHGESNARRSGVLEVLDQFVRGKCAMMYDATSLASAVEDFGSPVKDRVGYVPAPHDRTQNTGWIWTWAWGIENASKKKSAAWKFISWASSKQYQEEIGKEVGWNAAPAGNRKSLYRNPAYQDAAAAWYRQEYQAITNSADPENPGVSPRPYTGVQFVGIPEFADLGDKVSLEISRAIAGKQSVDTALAKSQQYAQAATSKYRAD